MRKECYYCHCKTKDQLIAKYELGADKAEEFSNAFESFIQHYWNLSNPLIATHVQRIAKEKFGQSDLYHYEKYKANTLFLNNYNYWKNIVDQNPKPFQMAAKLAVVGNIIDYGAHSVPDEIEKFIDAQLSIPLSINHSEVFVKLVKNAKSILYLGDNAGEIVFDKLFIETMNHPNITFVVRNEPVINDITMEDAQYTGIDKLCKVISNGYDAPSTLLEFCSDEFLTAYHKSDLVISKGQGNFEGLMDEINKPIVFLLMAKCAPIAKMLNTEKGGMIIKYNQEKV